ncbi:CheY-like chemotaxis protein [Rhodoligotrophos appendicifer]|uniref:response regulator n=1 Tax=Rhodoligotrophos appendicifer TaxID=987056 RepID=UPI001184E494|nr:response regulator [Rhodoligotrophos appendicifer]
MRTILIVDDEFGIVDVLVASLEDEGYRLFSASNGRRGLERLDETKPDLIVSDFMMPLMDGAAMGIEIRDRPGYDDVPIIMMSSVPESALRQRFAGYQAFLQKPFPIPVFLTLVDKLLGK